MLFKDNFDARDFWFRISNGDIDAETLEKLKHVAYDILQVAFCDEYDTPARRPNAVAEAVGRFGPMGKYPGLKDLALNELREMSPFDVASVGGLVLRDLPEDYNAKVAAKSVRAYRKRKP